MRLNVKMKVMKLFSSHIFYIWSEGHMAILVINGHFGHKWPYGHFFPVKTYGPKSSFGKFPSVYPMNIKKVPANGNFQNKNLKIEICSSKTGAFSHDYDC